MHPRWVSADAAYGTTENIAAIEKAGIRAYVALVDHEKRTSLFGRDAFTYDAEKDIYTCPQGELLRRRGYDYRERSIRYAARASACKTCSLKARCTKSTKGRWIRRSFEEKYLERVRAYHEIRNPTAQGHKETRGMGRAALRGGQGLAWVEKVPA